MDKKAFIRKLNAAFSELNNAGKKYSEVWLSEFDFGGLYYSDNYVLNVKANHHVNSFKEELHQILVAIDSKAHDELNYIWRVAIHGPKDWAHCTGDSSMVYSNDNVC